MHLPRLFSGKAISDRVFGQQGIVKADRLCAYSRAMRASAWATHWPIIDSPPTASRCPASSIF